LQAENSRLQKEKEEEAAKLAKALAETPKQVTIEDTSRIKALEDANEELSIRYGLSQEQVRELKAKLRAVKKEAGIALSDGDEDSDEEFPKFLMAYHKRIKYSTKTRWEHLNEDAGLSACKRDWIVAQRGRVFSSEAEQAAVAFDFLRQRDERQKLSGRRNSLLQQPSIMQDVTHSSPSPLPVSQVLLPTQQLALMSAAVGDGDPVLGKPALGRPMVPRSSSSRSPSPQERIAGFASMQPKPSIATSIPSFLSSVAPSGINEQSHSSALKPVVNSNQDETRRMPAAAATEPAGHQGPVTFESRWPWSPQPSGDIGFKEQCGRLPKTSPRNVLTGSAPLLPLVHPKSPTSTLVRGTAPTQQKPSMVLTGQEASKDDGNELKQDSTETISTRASETISTRASESSTPLVTAAQWISQSPSRRNLGLRHSSELSMHTVQEASQHITEAISNNSLATSPSGAGRAVVRPPPRLNAPGGPGRNRGATIGTILGVSGSASPTSALQELPAGPESDARPAHASVQPQQLFTGLGRSKSAALLPVTNAGRAAEALASSPSGTSKRRHSSSSGSTGSQAVLSEVLPQFPQGRVRKSPCTLPWLAAAT